MKAKPKHEAKALEFTFSSAAFNLIIERTEDGARTQRELDAAKEDHQRQQPLWPIATTPNTAGGNTFSKP